MSKNYFGYDRQILARICKSTYEYEDQRQSKLIQLLGDRFTILNEYSSRDILTVLDNEHDKIIISFRGTDLARDPHRAFTDLIADVNIAIGKNERVYRIQQGEILIRNILLAGIPRSKLILTGHSLGGFVGVNLGEKFNLPSVLFNIGSSPLDPKGVRRGLTNIVHITTNNLGVLPPVIDILSVSALFLYRFPYTIVNVIKGLSKHTIDNFL